MSLSLFTLFFLVYLFFAPITIISGDSGELVTTSALLGIPHPSGYPLYTIISKIFTFLPFGSIPFRIAIISPLFSSLSLVTLFNIVYRITKSRYSSLFASLSLFLSYSFFSQSLVHKFYTLNLSIILLIILLSTYLLQDGYKKKYLFLNAFILGISSGNHHTAFFMALPLLLLLLFYFKEAIKDIIFHLLFFLSGISINIYIFIRLKMGAITIFPIKGDLFDIIKLYILRGAYDSSSIEAVKSSLIDLSSYQNVLINLLKVIQVNYPLYFTYLFGILGIYFIFKLSNKLGLFLLSSFILYSLFLGKITMPQDNLEIKDYYIAAHQYFLPMFAIFSIFIGLGYNYTLIKLKNRSQLIYKTFFLFPIFTLILFPIRFKDNLWSNNTVLYQFGVDTIFTKPINSIYLISGDNPVFTSFYLKKIGNFRKDISIFVIASKGSYPIECCIMDKQFDNIYMSNDKIHNILTENYDKHFPSIFSFITSNIFHNFFYLPYFNGKLMINNDSIIGNTDIIQNTPLIETESDTDKDSLLDSINQISQYKKPIIDSLLLKNMNNIINEFRDYFNYLPCISHSTDDYFTTRICLENYINDLLPDNNINMEKLINYNYIFMDYVYNDKYLRDKYKLNEK